MYEALGAKLATGGKDLASLSTAEQFAAAKIEFDLIIRDRPEAVLFVVDGRAVTAWRENRPSGAVAFYLQAGFAAFPHAYVRGEAE